MIDVKGNIERFGVSPKAARIYLAALELGSAPAKKIAEKAGVQRTHFYDLAQQLIGMGLLKQIKQNGTTSFSATTPEQLVIQQEKRLEELKAAVPYLKMLDNNNDRKPNIAYYEGSAGVDEINEDTLRYEGEVLAFTTPLFIKTNQEKLGHAYIERRVALGKRVRIIGESSQELNRLRERDNAELRETRLLSKEIFSSSIEMGIYGNKVFIVDYRNQFGFIIESAEVAKVMKMIFEIIWKSDSVISK